MFHSARLTLTAWYLLLIMCICAIFSIAFYHASTREVQRLIDRIEASTPPPRQNNHPALEELQFLKRRSFVTLMLVNGVLLVTSAITSYFLAGKTLQPIQEMVEDQQLFIASASHELRTPLATLQAEMEAQLLQKNLSDKDVRTLIKSNLEELDSLQHLTDNLLQLTATHATTGEWSTEKISVSHILKTAEKKVAPTARQKKITIQTEKTSAFVNGNKHSLVEVFVILLDNALKYSPPRTSIKIAVQQQRQHVVIKVTDQGAGIAAADLPHIFEPFYRADATHTKAAGHGLGLPIAQKILEAHQGTLSVKSKKNVGSTFTIKLRSNLG